jgi:hypothetical protein
MVVDLAGDSLSFSKCHDDSRTTHHPSSSMEVTSR